MEKRCKASKFMLKIKKLFAYLGTSFLTEFFKNAIIFLALLDEYFRSG